MLGIRHRIHHGGAAKPASEDVMETPPECGLVGPSMDGEGSVLNAVAPDAGQAPVKLWP
ncbi:hypothetical protein CB1_001232015, partial [Camelus ferus]